MKKLSFNLRSVPAALLAFCLLAFGLLIPTLGFYWDDWQMIWFNYATGPSGLFQAFQGDRPVLALTFYLTSLITRPIPLDWQIMGLLSRFALALSFYWMIRQIWPKPSEAMVWAAILYAIYPGFKQQHISVIYANGFILLTALNLSIGFMAKAIRFPKRYWLYTVLALISFTFCTFSTEYYVGMELIRPLILFILIGRNIKGIKPRLFETAKQWLPYLVIMAIFLFWRVFIFGFPTYHPALIEKTSSGYLSKITYLIYRILFDIYQAGWLTWLQAFHFPTLKDFEASSMVFSWVVSVVAGILAFIYLLKLNASNQEPQTSEADYNLSFEFILVGALTMLVAGWPYWITNLPIDLTYQYDRFTLAFMSGSVLLLVGLIDWIFRLRIQKVILLSVLIGALCGTHLLNANSYRREWETLNDMFWQMTWRAPQIKQNTLLLTYTTPMQYYSDNSLTGPLNLIYAPDNHTLNLPYYLAFYDVRIGRSIPEIKTGLPVRQEYRSATFNGNTDAALVFFYSSDHCLRFLNPTYDNDLPILPNELKEASVISNINLIIPTPAQPATLNPAAFNKEPEHNWCYYFEKADLARQQDQWAEVVSLNEEAFQKDYWPKDPSELLPLIEGYARTDRWDQSFEKAKEVYKKMPSLHEQICDIFNRSQKNATLDAATKTKFNKTMHQILCK
jgi:hypothetical protein